MLSYHLYTSLRISKTVVCLIDCLSVCLSVCMVTGKSAWTRDIYVFFVNNSSYNLGHYKHPLSVYNINFFLFKRVYGNCGTCFYSTTCLFVPSIRQRTEEKDSPSNSNGTFHFLR